MATAFASKPPFENRDATWAYASIAAPGSPRFRCRSPSLSRAFVSSGSVLRCFRYSLRALSKAPFWMYFCACSSAFFLPENASARPHFPAGVARPRPARIGGSSLRKPIGESDWGS